MQNQAWRRAFWLLVALVVFAPPVAMLAFQPPTDALRGALGSIPAPQPVEIRPRLFVAYGALVAASTLGILYLYRGRPFVVYWIVSWSMLAASYTLNARGYADVRLGSVMIGLSQLLTVWSAGLLLLSVDDFSKKSARRWNVPLQLGAAAAVWFLAAPFALPLSAVLYTGPAACAVLLGWAGVRYAQLAKRTPIIGAFMMSAALGVMSLLNVAGAALTYRLASATSYTNALLALSIVTSIFIALGMHLLVFEDMTDEIRRTNLALATANEQIKQMAITDPLTGCYNRRFFDEIGRREMQRFRRYGKPLAVVFVDINRFKYLNDRLGHDTGDTVLRTLGSMLRRHVRQSDYVIRWGGDEFLLLLTCTATEAARKAEELKAAFALERAAAGLPADTGLSIGVSEVEVTAETLGPAIRVADSEMYRDKLGEGAGI
ncbi:MAG TPA: GGDEF domain-containing protein [Vicinamibacterales bacterium]|nr:GGDEF domain-containing protein [Vicinamibacterales bacterium]